MSEPGMLTLLSQVNYYSSLTRSFGKWVSHFVTFVPESYLTNHFFCLILLNVISDFCLPNLFLRFDMAVCGLGAVYFNSVYFVSLRVFVTV